MASKPTWFEQLLWGKSVKGWSDLAHAATRYKYVMLTGKPPERWPEQWHAGTSYKHYRQPTAEVVEVWKHRINVISSKPFRWPDQFHVSTRKRDTSTADSGGIGTGTPLQAGTDQMRTLSYGWATWGQKAFSKIPRPRSGRYWISGAPAPAYDRNAIIAGPDGLVYELIQFDPDAIENPVTNQALGLGVFRDGELVEGKPTGAGRVANSAFVWDQTSSSRPHTQAIILSDYYGHDGLLPASMPGRDVPHIGDYFALDPNSASARAMIALGGECAARALALINHGCKVVDRSGYSDVKDNSKDIGKAPHPTTMSVQAGTWARDNNLPEFTVALEDLRYVTDFEVAQ